MRSRNRTYGATALAAAVSVTAALTLVLGTPSSQATPAGPQGRAAVADLSGLKVLLTNDDSARNADVSFGTDGKGLYELRKALCGAGADVLVVAPWRQQSGASVRVAIPGFTDVPLTVQAVAPAAAYSEDCAAAASAGAVFGVCQAEPTCTSATPSASPSDAVYVAVERFAATYWSGGPDVVLSGVNFGQNLGTTTNHSGTVGAAVTANELGVPTIALSAEVPFVLEQIPNVPFAQTSAFAVELLQKLVGADQLKPGLMLNVNYPFVGADEQLGTAVNTVVGASTDIAGSYEGDVPKTGGTYQLTIGTPDPETRPDADTTAIQQNNISVTQLDGNWSLPNPGDFLGSLEPGPVDPPAPIRTAVSATATPQRDQTRPYATVVAGRIRGSLGASDCRGTVRLVARGTVRARNVRHLVVVQGIRTVRLQATASGCTFTGKVTVRPRRAALTRRALRGRVTVRVAFSGNEALVGSSTSVRFRLG